MSKSLRFAYEEILGFAKKNFRLKIFVWSYSSEKMIKNGGQIITTRKKVKIASFIEDLSWNFDKKISKKFLKTYLFSKNNEQRSLYSEIKFLKIHFDRFEKLKKSLEKSYSTGKIAEE